MRGNKLFPRQPLPVHLAFAGLACLIVIARRPDAFSNPQFYAEDGAHWFSDAYNEGTPAILMSNNGYLQLLPRLVGFLSAPFGVVNTPVFFNVIGLAVQVAPALFFLTLRFQHLVPSRWARAALAGTYLLMPSSELNVTITNAQWHLVILAVLVVFAAPSPRWYWRVFDMLVVVLSALSGPFAFILLPLALLWLAVCRYRWTLALVALLAVALIAQLYSVTHSVRPSLALGASLHDLVLLVADRILLAGLFAEEGHTHLFLAGTTHGTIIAAALCAIGALIAGLAALRAPIELRFFGLAALAIVAAGLLSPLVSATGNQWKLMATSSAGERYFFMAQVAWVVTLVWVLSRARRRTLRVAALGTVGACFLAGVVTGWRYPRFADYHWQQVAQLITTSRSGTHVVAPIPPGPPWTVDVTVR